MRNVSPPQSGEVTGYPEMNVETKLADAQAFDGYNDDALDSLNKALAFYKQDTKHVQDMNLKKELLQKKSKILTSLGRTAEAAQAKTEADNIPRWTPPSLPREEPITPIIAVMGILCALFIFARKTRK